MSKTIDYGQVKGVDGKTAYQYAVEGGYTGTEAEFLDLMATVPTHIGDTVSHISTTAKDTLADGDSLVLSDSADGGKSKRVLWSKVTSLLASVFAAKSHTHTKSNITDFPSSMTPSAHAASHSSSGADRITPANIGAADASHKHAWSDITSKPSAFTPASHNQAASTITAGTFAATGVKAATGTDYTTARVRNIQASTADLTAGSSALANGDIYLVYE